MGNLARTVSRGHTFLESPRWHLGDLYVSDFFTNRVLRFKQGSSDCEVVLEVPGIPSGLGFLPDGSLLVVSMRDRCIMRFGDGQTTVHADLRRHSRYPLNDMFVDPRGRCYVGGLGHTDGDESDFGAQPLIVVQVDGSVHTVDAELNFPNGIVGDGTHLYVAETYAGAVRVFEVDANGTPHSPRIWAQFGQRPESFDIEEAHQRLAMEPDGLALSSDGTLWVADAKGHGVSRVREGGEIIDFVETAPLSVFAATESDDGKSLYMCCSPPNRTVDWSKLNASELRVAEIGCT